MILDREDSELLLVMGVGTEAWTTGGVEELITWKRRQWIHFSSNNGFYKCNSWVIDCKSISVSV